MGLFTIEFELGPQTRAMVERVAATAVMRVELGPETLKTIADLKSPGKAREAIEGLLRKRQDD